MVGAVDGGSAAVEYYDDPVEKEPPLKHLTHGPFQVTTLCDRTREIFDRVSEVKSQEDQEKYWGYHLILDCKSCDIDKITSRENLAAFATEMVRRIDMKAYGEPQLNHFATHCPEAAGYTLTQLIETSLISGHFVDKNGDAYVDIFSCKEFSIQTAKDVVNEFLRPEHIRMTFLTRQA